jgi:glycogen operon protein
VTREIAPQCRKQIHAQQAEADQEPTEAPPGPGCGDARLVAVPRPPPEEPAQDPARPRSLDGATLRGTVAGLTTKRVIDHFKYLGVDAVELMPTVAWIDDGHLPALGLTNAWGYNPVTYFAVDPRLAPRGPQELRVMTDLYRKNGISVILDVVYNHTGEGSRLGPTLSFRGLDNAAYYRLVPEDPRQYWDSTGTGNTLDLGHPAVLRMVMDSLRYWVQEMHVDGFRFDLAATLARGRTG